MFLSDLRKTYLDNIYGEENSEIIRNANESGRTRKSGRGNARRRNATIRIEENTFKGQSVRELCIVILKYLCDHNHIEILGMTPDANNGHEHTLSCYLPHLIKLSHIVSR